MWARLFQWQAATLATLVVSEALVKSVDALARNRLYLDTQRQFPLLPAVTEGAQQPLVLTIMVVGQLKPSILTSLLHMHTTPSKPLTA